jgi:uncharacterized protein DUF3592
VNPGLLTFALAPAIPGVVSIALGVGIFTVLARDTNTPEEAAVRLFAAAFVLLGAFFIRRAMREASAAPRRRNLNNGPRPAVRSHLASLLWAIVDAVVVLAIVIPFHVWWQAPWAAFGTAVLILDVVAFLVLVRLVVCAWRWARRLNPAPPPPVPSRRGAARALGRWRFALLLFGVLTGLIAWAGVPLAIADWQGWSKLTDVEGEVIRQHSYGFRGREGGRTTMAAAVVRYAFGGQTFESFQPMDPASPLFRKGARMTLRVDPSNPRVARAASAFDVFLIPFVLLLGTMFFFGMTAISAARVAALRE